MSFLRIKHPGLSRSEIVFLDLRNKPELLQKFFELFDFLILDKDNLKYPKSLLKSSNDFDFIPIVTNIQE